MPVLIKRPGGFHFCLLVSLSCTVVQADLLEKEVLKNKRPHGGKRTQADNQHEGSRPVNQALNP